MITLDDDEVWYWHKCIEGYLSQPLPQKAYCEQHNINYKTFCNRYYRIVYKSVKHPEEYKRLVPIARKYLASGGKAASQFAKANDIHVNTLSEMVTHLGYKDAIEKLKAEREGMSMKFIQVPSVQPRPPTGYRGNAIEPEVMKKQNDVELIISAGVKVVVAPEVGADKLIRIIELLKDL